MARAYLSTGQRRCFDEAGRVVRCIGSGQDGEHAPGVPWPVPRFRAMNDVVQDRLTGLCWLKHANHFEWPMPWAEAIARATETDAPRGPWRLPTRRELRSLTSFATRDPALPEGHPFDGVWLGWYWTSTTAAPNPEYAWYVHMEGGRTFYGRKDEDHLVWPVCGASFVLPACCANPRADDPGLRWPEPRFVAAVEQVNDRLTELTWCRCADSTAGPVTWAQALASVAALARNTGQPWRLPTINELETLVDASAHHPALTPGHPFTEVQEVYWSSTSSGFEPDWAMALYLDKGAVGVGQKKLRCCSVWPVLG